MHRHWHRVVGALAAALLAGLAMASPAWATTDVLTVDSPGGPNVAMGDVLLASGASSFCSTSGSACIKCPTTTFSGTVGTNPPAPGTATGTVDRLTVSGCTTSISGCTLMSVGLPNLPLAWSVSSNGAVTIAPGGSGAIQVKFTLVCAGLTVTCAYRPHDSSGDLFGMWSGSTVTFTNVQFDKFSGPNICLASGLFNAKLAVTDATQGGQPVFVN